jgi:hypothetical protein
MTACAGGASASNSTGQKVSGGTIVYAHQQEPACVFGGWIEQAYLSYKVLDNLTSLDANHKVVSWLATSWMSSADGLRISRTTGLTSRAMNASPGGCTAGLRLSVWPMPAGVTLSELGRVEIALTQRWTPPINIRDNPGKILAWALCVRRWPMRLAFGIALRRRRLSLKPSCYFDGGGPWGRLEASHPRRDDLVCDREQGVNVADLAAEVVTLLTR